MSKATIELKHHKKMNELAGFLDEVFNGCKKGEDREYGFFLSVFPFGEKEGRFNYIANSERVDIIKLLEEMLVKFKGE